MPYYLIVTESDQLTINAFHSAFPDQLELVGSRIDIFAAFLVRDPSPEALVKLEAQPGYIGMVDLG